jgi:hypothetical protein
MAMRTIVLALSTTLLATTLLAQETAPRPAAPDYSRPTLMRIFVIDPQTGPPTPSVEPEVGAVRVRSRFGNLLLGYLPFFAPLPGSVPTTTRQVVDPFVMTNLEIPAGPRVMRRERARELRRIDRLTHGGAADGSSSAVTTKATSATVEPAKP